MEGGRKAKDKKSREEKLSTFQNLQRKKKICLSRFTERKSSNLGEQLALQSEQLSQRIHLNHRTPLWATKTIAGILPLLLCVCEIL